MLRTGARRAESERDDPEQDAPEDEPEQDDTEDDPEQELVTTTCS